MIQNILKWLIPVSPIYLDWGELQRIAEDLASANGDITPAQAIESFIVAITNYPSKGRT